MAISITVHPTLHMSAELESHSHKELGKVSPSYLLMNNINQSHDLHYPISSMQSQLTSYAQSAE